VCRAKLVERQRFIHRQLFTSIRLLKAHLFPCPCASPHHVLLQASLSPSASFWKIIIIIAIAIAIIIS
jgi:hypothetical protein